VPAFEEIRHDHSDCNRNGNGNGNEIANY